MNESRWDSIGGASNCDWQTLADRIGRGCLFSDFVRIREDGWGWTVTSSRRMLWIGLIVTPLAALGAWCFYRYPALTPKGSPPWLPVCCIALLFGVALLCCYVGLLGRRMRWSPKEGVLHIRFSRILYWPVCRVSVPIRDLAVDLECRPGDRPGSRQLWYCLMLRHLPSDVAIMLTWGSREPVANVYNTLRRGLTGQGEDVSLFELPLEDGRILRFPADGARSMPFENRNAWLNVQSPDVATIQPTLKGKVRFLFYLAFCFVAPVLIALAAHVPWQWVAGAGAFAYLVAARLLWVPMGGMITITFDLKREEVTSTRRPGESLAMKDVAAVQICAITGYSPSSQSPFAAWQANLILAEPPGERATVMCHGNESALRADAARLAEFLGRPLLNHA